MRNNKYIGHDSQLFGVEECRLVGGKGDGMRLLHVKNGCGLEFTVSVDRCADISRLSLDGKNFGYFSPCGYVDAPYYDDKGLGWLKSFTAGFFTTCGLSSAGNPGEDQGDEFGLHGSVGNAPAEWVSYEVLDSEIVIKARVNQMGIFKDKLVLNREYRVSLEKNEIQLKDTVTNYGSAPAPVMILYHMNMGYPLLSEKTELYVPGKKVTPRNEHSAKDLDTWNVVLPPTAGFEEQCYYHDLDEKGQAGMYNPDIEKGMGLTIDTSTLNYFTQWKMMGEKDYVIGLEPGNCDPDGRAKAREEGRLNFIDPDQSVTYEMKISLLAGEKEWEEFKK